MSSYITKQNLLDVGAMPADDIENFDLDQPTLLPALISAISSYADTFLRKRYTLPLKSPYPDELIYHVVNLVVYRLYQRRGAEYTSEHVAQLKQDWDNAVAWLTDISLGKLELSGDQDATPNLDENNPIVKSLGSPYKWYDKYGGGSSYYRYKYGC